MRRFCFFLVLTLMGSTALAQDFSGNYTSEAGAGTAVLTLTRNATGDYSGKLEATGMSLIVKGRVKNKVLSGTVGDGSEELTFRAEWVGKQLALSIFEADENGKPIPDSKQTLNFERAATAPDAPSTGDGKNGAQVIINGLPLTGAQITEIEKTYGVKPKGGNYWYDAKSGLYGVVGFAAYGYMQPGHQFGAMKSNVSKGTTGVFINGRELSPAEYTVWSSMVGSWIQPGRYWLDHQGNAGYEGNPAPVINLFVAAKNNGYNGQGGSGDNFWTSRFSAGNSDSGGQRGYVSVPGYGPVGYGF